MILLLLTIIIVRGICTIGINPKPSSALSSSSSSSCNEDDHFIPGQIAIYHFVYIASFCV